MVCEGSGNCPGGVPVKRGASCCTIGKLSAFVGSGVGVTVLVGNVPRVGVKKSVSTGRVT